MKYRTGLQQHANLTLTFLSNLLRPRRFVATCKMRSSFVRSDREGLQQRGEVEEMQMRYALMLQKYEKDQKAARKGSRKNFANLLGKLPELARIR